MIKGSWVVLDIEGSRIQRGARASQNMWCIGVRGPDLEYRSFNQTNMNDGDLVKILNNADYLIAHNGLGYDYPMLRKFIKGYKPKGKELDSLMLSRALVPDIGRFFPKVPDKLRGLHGLNAWGYRVGIMKGEYTDWCLSHGFEDPWAQYTAEMEVYMKSDVDILYRVMLFLMTQMYPGFIESMDIDHRFQEYLYRLLDDGIPIDQYELFKLKNKIQSRTESLETKIWETIPYIVKPSFPDYRPEGRIGTMAKKLLYGNHIYPPAGPREFFGTERRIPRTTRFSLTQARLKHYADDIPIQDTNDAPFIDHRTEGALYCEVDIDRFNPNSRPQIAQYLVSKSWVPSQFAKKGGIKVNDKVLTSLLDLEQLTPTFIEYLMLRKRLSYIYSTKKDGKSLYQCLHDNKIFPSITHYGAKATGRCNHTSPNISQASSVKLFKDEQTGKTSVLKGDAGEYRYETRALFRAPAGYYAFGADISGMEMMLLGHYLNPYDDGALLDNLTDPDFDTHEDAAKVIALLKDHKGVPVKARRFLARVHRQMAKGIRYAVNYGGQALKVGSMICPTLPIPTQRLVGTLVIPAMNASIEGLPELLVFLEKFVFKHGYVDSFSRRFDCDQTRLALNKIMQSSGALCARSWTVFFLDSLEGLDYRFILFNHDEVLLYVNNSIDSKIIGDLAEKAIYVASKSLNLVKPLEVDWKTGETWADVH